MAKILIIDDSPSALALAELILAECGHQVIVSLSASDGMRFMVQMPVDMIITDLYMPDKDGLEVIREAHRVRPDIPVIAISGVEGAKDMLSAAKFMGAAFTIRKPFTKHQLLEAVDIVVAEIAAKKRLSELSSQGAPRG